MAKERLPDEAFEYYVGLGFQRSYQATADHYGVTKRCVARRAKAENWQQRLAERERGIQAAIDSKAEDRQRRHVERMNELQDAVLDVVTPQRVKGIVAALIKASIDKCNVHAARLLFERVMGRPRNEPLAATALDIPDGLGTATDVRVALNALLQAVADGSLAPEDAAKAAAVIEAARRSIETVDLEKRITAIEENQRKERAS